MTTIKAGTTSTTGFVVDTDNSGTLILQAGGSNNAVVIDSQTQQATFTQAISQPGAFMFRNKIINGNFDVWQRGTSQTSAAFGSADRWFCDHVGSTKTASRQMFTLGQTDVPNSPKFFMRHVVTSVAGAGNYCLMWQKIENVEILSGKTVTVSFWAKADSAKNIAVEFEQSFGTGGSPSGVVSGIGSQLIALTTTWARYTATINIPSIAGKTLGTDDNNCLLLLFWFDAGSNWNSRAASLGQRSGTFDIAQVQVEEGAVATPFEQRPFGMELALCQRYYQESKNILTLFRATTSGNFGGAYLDVRFVTEFRITPTLAFFTNTAKTTSGILVNGATTSTSYLVGNSSTLGFAIWNNAALTTDGAYGGFYYTASAEL